MIVPVGDGCELAVEELVAPRDGPTLTVLGGVHGDELEGILAARLFARSLSDTLRCGRVRVVAVANPPAHVARARCTPIDGRNLARTFPGSTTGTLTERIADALTRTVIAGSDLLVDLHSAGAAYEMPVFAGCVVDAGTGSRARCAAEAFDAPVLWLHHGMNPGRSLAAADALGVPAIYAEGSGGGGLRAADLDVYTRGLHNVLAWLGMAEGPAAPSHGRLVLEGGTGDIDASLSAGSDGWCVTRVAAGQQVCAGEIVATIHDETGGAVETIRSPRPGTVMMLRRDAEVARGDGVAMLGPPPC